MMRIELKVIQQLKITEMYNKILFYLQKFPFLGKKIPNRFYNAADFKMAITIIGAVAFVLFQFLTKALYFTFLYTVSNVAFLFENGNQQEVSTIFMTLRQFLKGLATAAIIGS